MYILILLVLFKSKLSNDIMNLKQNKKNNKNPI